jgi:uncharacterized protein (TIGR00290 family)
VKRILLAWSGGKDCAWALHTLRRQGGVEIAGLLVTFNQEFQRVSMHGVPRTLIERQAEAAGLPLWPVELPWPCPNDVYEARMAAACARAAAAGVEAVAFGDLFLEDVRSYRERQMSGTGLQALFPLWGRETAGLAREMLAGGLRAVTACVDPKRLAADFCGREYDTQFLSELPHSVDPCGENGEFHTFVYSLPEFAAPVRVESAGRVTRDGFMYADLRPV